MILTFNQKTHESIALKKRMQTFSYDFLIETIRGSSTDIKMIKIDRIR